jgi:thiol-disulfide isomerase/thioredoxin
MKTNRRRFDTRWLPLIVVAAMLLGARGLAVGPGDPAPTLSVGTLDGQVTLTNFKSSKATVVNFWATWCEPCKDEMPALQELYERRSADGLQVVGVHLLGKRVGEINAFLEERGIDYPVRLGDTDDAERWTVGLLPTSFLIDGNGVVVRRYVGATPEQVAGLVADVNAWLDGERLGTMIESEQPAITIP